MRRTKARRNAPSLSFVQTYRRRMSNEPDIVLCDFFAHSSLRVGIKQEELAVGDPVSGSGADYRWGNMEGTNDGVLAIRMKSDVITWPVGADGYRRENKYCG